MSYDKVHLESGAGIIRIMWYSALLVVFPHQRQPTTGRTNSHASLTAFCKRLPASTALNVCYQNGPVAKDIPRAKKSIKDRKALLPFFYDVRAGHRADISTTSPLAEATNVFEATKFSGDPRVGRGYRFWVAIIAGCRSALSVLSCTLEPA